METKPTSDPASNVDPRAGRALEELRSLLVPGEQLEAYAIQRRLFALTRRRVIVGATTGRVIALMRGLFGGFQPEDVRWQDLHDAQLRVGIFSATLTISAYVSNDLASASSPARAITLVGLRKAEAQAVYRLCQAQEQAWREKRRVRDLEELRAKSGGVQLAQGVAAAGSAAAADDDKSPGARLERAREMLQKGLLTDAEYEQIKARIVADL